MTAWQFGIDEAGYGPNLGPLVQSAVGVCVPGDPAACDLWATLAAAVRKYGNGRDKRLAIDDSKKVYGSAHNLKNLELGVLAVLLTGDGDDPATVGAFLDRFAGNARADLGGEAWFEPDEPLPVACSATQARVTCWTFHTARTAAEVGTVWARVRLTPVPLFNALLDEFESKGNVLAHGLRWLLREARHPDDGTGQVFCAVDRQGGRRYHIPLIESACPDGKAEIISEGEACCDYRMAGRREWRWRFEVEAESKFLTVALASMLSKYIRELLMRQFNRFWQTHVPGIKSTAGYPMDATRFYQEIRPAMERLDIAEKSVWRRK